MQETHGPIGEAVKSTDPVSAPAEKGRHCQRETSHTGREDGPDRDQPALLRWLSWDLWLEECAGPQRETRVERG